MFENLSSNGKLIRILAALCRRSGGELRIPLDEVDTPGDPTQLDYFRDRATQEFIVRTAKENEVLIESMRLTPEVVRPATTAVATPAPIPINQPVPEGGFTASSKGLSEEQLASIEKSLQKRRVAALLREELRQRRVEPQQ